MEKVISLELAKRLKEIGIDAPSEHHWWKYPKNHFVMNGEWAVVDFVGGEFTDKELERGYPAYSLQELLEVLKQLGTKKGWDLHYTLPVIRTEDYRLVDEINVYESGRHFLKCAELYAEGGMKSVSEYVNSLL